MPAYNRRVSIPGKSSQELYDKVSKDIDRFLAKTNIGRFNIDRNPKTKEVSVKSPMFSAALRCTDGEISVEGQLSLLAAPFRSKIDDGIDHWIAKTFNQVS